MTDEIKLLFEIFGFLIIGGGAYAAIRGDLGRLHERSTVALNSAQRAHDRIDKMQGNSGD